MLYYIHQTLFFPCPHTKERKGSGYMRLLKAIPWACLSLATPSSELVVELCLWLGLTLFPFSPLCTCLSPIDSFGDHLLGCSHGYMRIHWHDTLVNIIYSALSQDLRPGDIFIRTVNMVILHNYFDVSISVETGSGHPGQPGHIFSGSSGSDPVYKLSGSDPDWITWETKLIVWRRGTYKR